MTAYRNADGTTTRFETRETFVEPRCNDAGRFFLILLVLAATIDVPTVTMKDGSEK